MKHTHYCYNEFNSSLPFAKSPGDDVANLILGTESCGEFSLYDSYLTKLLISIDYSFVF